MINQQQKQEIIDSLKALNNENDTIRNEAIKRIGEIGYSHPQIIERLQELNINDPSPDVRLTAQHVLRILQINPNESIQIKSSQSQMYESISKTENDILEKIQKQNEILENIRTLIVSSLEIENEKKYQIRSRITDFNMSIGSMIILSFKWFVAAIPVGIVIGILISILQSCTSPY